MPNPSLTDKPVFALTVDIDWASEACIADVLGIASSFGITPTLFMTHRSACVDRFVEEHGAQIGVHPNFRRGSTHGSDIASIVEHCFDLYPTARTFRSHAFYDSTDILAEMSRRGTRYDSNLCLHLQPSIVPLTLGAEPIVRLPVFWGDDCHWRSGEHDWDVERLLPHFRTPGLKLIAVHAFNVAFNVPDQAYYDRHRDQIQLADADAICALRWAGQGTRTFLCGLLDALTSSGARFLTLDEIYRKYPPPRADV
ncbi:MAG: hypothetical protein ABGY41_11470 [Candidatus Poribacteria bacterium]